MKLCLTFELLAFACFWPELAGAQLQLLPSREPQRVFSGVAKNVSVTFSNAGGEDFAADLRVRVFQTTSATAVQLGDLPWKTLRVLSQQTVLESAPLNFPAVNAPTKFLIQWLADTNHVIGTTTMLVYPTNLLAELKPLFGQDGLGVLDPNDALKLSLKQNDVSFVDLGEMALEDFSGKLAIIGPFQSRTQMREGLPQTIQHLTMKGTPVVWIQPPAEPKDEIKPSFYVVPAGKGVVVVVQPDLVTDLSENPKSQLNLIHFCKLALNPVPSPLPNWSPQP